MPVNLSDWLDSSLDVSAIYETLGEIEQKPMEYQHSAYYMDYADLFEEMSLIASELYGDMERLVREMDCTWELPPKNRRELEELYGSEYPNGSAWFNTVSALMDETPMKLLMEHDGFYNPYAEENERKKRIRAVSCLTKEKLVLLFTEAYKLLTRYLRLTLTYQSISGLIEELEYLHSFRERKGQTELPPTAYVE